MQVVFAQVAVACNRSCSESMRIKSTLELIGIESMYHPLLRLTFLLSVLWFVCSQECFSQPIPTSAAKNVVLITMDGMRLEEVFLGADQRLVVPELGCQDVDGISNRFGVTEPEESRRALLMPFLWNRIHEGGWIAGDIQLDSTVLVTNGRYFSYPGYNELLTGKVDHDIDSNDKHFNKNVTVLEWLNQQPGFHGKVAAYCSWDVFPFIINTKRCGFIVNGGWMPLEVGAADRVAQANFLAEHLFHEWEGVRYDAFTAVGAIEEIKQNQPRVLYVALGETDDWAHAGRYDRYLQAAKQNDHIIQSLWDACQSQEQYRDQTAFLITSDHGRGDGREGWKNHSDKLPGSERIWVAAFGAGVATTGIDHGGRFQQSQVAATVSALVGLDFTQSDPMIAPPLPITSATKLDQ